MAGSTDITVGKGMSLLGKLMTSLPVAGMSLPDGFIRKEKGMGGT